MTEQALWNAFLASHPDAVGSGYTSWQFGDAPDQLARLVQEGIKTATASAAVFYDLEQEPLPSVGDYNIVLDSLDRPVCVTRTTRVYVVPFDQVSPAHAWKEGEGNRSLDHWRRVHRDFFTGELAEAGLAFREDMPVVCEEFELVFPTS